MNTQVIKKDGSTGIGEAPKGTLASFVFKAEFFTDQPRTWFLFKLRPKFIFNNS